MENFTISFQVLFLTKQEDGSHSLHKKRYFYRKSQDDWNNFLQMPVQLTGIRLLRQLLRTETQTGRSEREEIMKELELHPMKFSLSRKDKTRYIDETSVTEQISGHFERVVQSSPDEKEMRFTALFVRL